MALRKYSGVSGGKNYLPYVLGGIFLVAVLIILAYSAAPFSPMEGCIGVISINGPIVSQDMPPSLFSDEVKGSETLASEIMAANARDDVKSVLVLINSPGGSVVASNEVYAAVKNLSKPTVSYIHEIGASGGYLVAAGTGYIIANPDALVGSIGARATFADMSGLFEKLGYNETSIKSGAMKDMGSPSRPMTPEELAVMQSIVDESFAEFKNAVEEGRKGRLNAALFAQALDARIMTGRQAKKAGLVDELGNKKAAIMAAAGLGGITSGEPRLCELSSTQGERGLFSSFSGEMIDFIVKSSGAPRLAYG